MKKILNEPALIAGALQAVIGLLLAFGVELTNEQIGSIMAVSAAALAIFVRQSVVPTNKLEGGEL